MIGDDGIKGIFVIDLGSKGWEKFEGEFEIFTVFLNLLKDKKNKKSGFLDLKLLITKQFSESFRVSMVLGSQLKQQRTNG